MNKNTLRKLLTPRRELTIQVPRLEQIAVSANQYKELDSHPVLHKTLLDNIFKIQSLIRMYLVRCRVIRYLKYLTAVIFIQAVYKGYRVRKRFSFNRKKKCPDCAQLFSTFLYELRSMRVELLNISKVQKVLQERSQRYESAFRYLFETLNSIKS